MRVHLTPKSSNGKTGPIPVSTTSEDSCPISCPLKNGACYGKRGPIRLHWDRVSSGLRGWNWDRFCQEIARLPIGTLWRHNQVGDLPANRHGMIDRRKLGKLVAANKGKRGFTYTHHEHYPENLDTIRKANKNGFTINLSLNSLAEIESAPTDIPLSVMLPLGTDWRTKKVGSRIVVRCPAEYVSGLTCSSCELCQKPGRKCIVGLTAHGTKKREADRIARGLP